MAPGWMESAKKGRMGRSPEGESKGEARYFSHFLSPLASALAGLNGSCCFSCQPALLWFSLPQMSQVPGLWTTSSSLCSSRIGLVTASWHANLWVATPCSSSTFQTRSHIEFHNIKNTGSLFLAGTWLFQWGIGDWATNSNRSAWTQGTRYKSASPHFQPLEDCLTHSLPPHLFHNHFISSSPWRKKASTVDLSKCNLKLSGNPGNNTAKSGTEGWSSPKDMVKNREGTSIVLGREGLWEL